MTLVDTSIWIDHFRLPDARLMHLLAEDSVWSHPFIVGELAAGSLPKRAAALSALRLLPQVPVALDIEVHYLLESSQLWSLGLGWVDLHLLRAAQISGCNLLTADHAMMTAAKKLGIAYPAN